MQLVAQLIDILAPVFVGAGIGFAWGRRGQPFDLASVTALTVNVGAPCLVLSIASRGGIDAAAVGETALLWLFCTLGFAAVGAVVLAGLGWPLRNHLGGILFPNIGNTGLPLSLFAFGEAGLTLAIGVFATGVVLANLVSPLLYAGSSSLRPLLRQPVLYAAAGAAILFATGTTPPAWFRNTVELLGGLTIPIMLLSLGVSIGRLRIVDLRQSLVLGLLRLAIGFAVGLAVCAIAGLEGPARGVLLIQASMPVAVFNYLWAEHYGRSPEQAAGSVIVSTAVSFATLPLLLSFVL